MSSDTESSQSDEATSLSEASGTRTRTDDQQYCCDDKDTKEPNLVDDFDLFVLPPEDPTMVQPDLESSDNDDKSIRRVSQRSGLKVFYDAEECNIFWTDFSVSNERVCSLKHLLSYSKQYKHKTYILKPDAGCQGKGIYLTKNVNHIRSSERMVCQVYISRPFLIDGFKFDMRLYVLVTSCDPLRVYVFKDGLARFATQCYREPTNANVANVFIHLTNYAVQKLSKAFIRDDEDCGTKRRITTINRWLIVNGYDVDKIWADVDDAIIKTLLSGYAVLKHNYRTSFPTHSKTTACFEILGFDIMLDKKLKPYVLEVNHSPSFQCDSRLDKEIKEALLWDTMKLINLPALDRKACIDEDRKRIRDRLFNKTGKNLKENRVKQESNYYKNADQQEAYELQNLGNFRKIYPPLENRNAYEQYFTASGSLYSETVSFKARSEFARQVREELREKQEKDNYWKRKSNTSQPESPRSRSQRASIKTAPLRKISSRSSINISAELREPLKTSLSSINTHQPIPILDIEENERIMQMVQREAMLKRLGVVDLVYKLLSGSVGVAPFLPLPKTDLQQADLTYFSNAHTKVPATRSHNRFPQSAHGEEKLAFTNDIWNRKVESRSGNLLFGKETINVSHYWVNGSLKKPQISKNFSNVSQCPMTLTNFITKPALLTRDTISLDQSKRATSEM
ncbi:Tubulin polyglutamylase ttll6, partial [Cichlidogyrus casuarinus]